MNCPLQEEEASAVLAGYKQHVGALFDHGFYGAMTSVDGPMSGVY